MYQARTDTLGESAEVFDAIGETECTLLQSVNGLHEGPAGLAGEEAAD